MKALKISTLAAITLMMGLAHAEPLSVDEIFHALDAESEYTEAYEFDSNERVNFSIAPSQDHNASENLDTHDFWDNPGLLGSYD